MTHITIGGTVYAIIAGRRHGPGLRERKVKRLRAECGGGLEQLKRYRWYMLELATMNDKRVFGGCRGQIAKFPSMSVPVHGAGKQANSYAGE